MKSVFNWFKKIFDNSKQITEDNSLPKEIKEPASKLDEAHKLEAEVFEQVINNPIGPFRAVNEYFESRPEAGNQSSAELLAAGNWVGVLKRDANPDPNEGMTKGITTIYQQLMKDKANTEGKEHDPMKMATEALMQEFEGTIEFITRQLKKDTSSPEIKARIELVLLEARQLVSNGKMTLEDAGKDLMARVSVIENDMSKLSNFRKKTQQKKKKLIKPMKKSKKAAKTKARK